MPIEIKSSATFNSSFMKGINHFFLEFDKSTNKGFVVYNGEYEQLIDKIDVINYFSLRDKVKENLKELNSG